MPDEARERLAAFGDELVAIHQRLRTELALLRQEAGAGNRPRDLTTHCLAFCTALTSHHTGEDRGAFPALAARYPDLEPVIAKMREDHELISGLLHSLERLLATAPADASRLRSELDGISAIAESHFAFEERTIVSALNAIPAGTATTEQLLGLPGSEDTA
jgi:hemerythrin-like domain-containing protein